MSKGKGISYRFRLMIGLPVIVMCFTMAAGFFPLGILSSSLKDVTRVNDLLPVLQNLRISVLIVTLAATTLAAAIAAYIVRPIEQITQEMAELAAEGNLELQDGDSPDEITALTRIYRQAVVPIKGMLASSDLLMQMSEGLIGLNRAGNVQMINSPVETLLGMSRRDWVGKHYAAMFPPDGPNAEVHDLIREAERRFVEITRDVIIETHAGRGLYVRITVSPATGPGNEPLGLVLLIKNFEEVNRLKDHLRRLDVLASLGTSVAGMAHEVRTPLGYIRGLTELIAEDLPKDARQQEYLKTILESVDRLNVMVGNILSLARLPSDQMILEDPVTLVRESVAYTRSALQPNRLILVEDYAEYVPRIRGDRDRLLEAFTNLFKNACEASPPEGTVTVRVRPVRIGGPSKDGSAVMIEFHNTGTPIPPEKIDKLFTPFFTTKKEGTGLGLAITKQIVDNHDGAIRVESDAATGTLFRTILPAEDN